MLQTNLIGTNLIWICNKDEDKGENVIVRAAWIHGISLRLLIERTDGRLTEIRATECKVSNGSDK